VSTSHGVNVTLWCETSHYSCERHTMRVNITLYACDNQHRFVGVRSTMTSLVDFSNFVLFEMEDGLQVDAVYTIFLKIELIIGCCWAR
jgi:hypothetical protein